MSCLSSCSTSCKVTLIGYAVFAVLLMITAIALVAITGGAVAAPAALGLSASAGAALCMAADVCYISALITLGIGVAGIFVMLCCKGIFQNTTTQPKPAASVPLTVQVAESVATRFAQRRAGGS